MSDLFWLNDAQWARLQPLLPTDVRGVPRVDDRRVISGIIMCSGPAAAGSMPRRPTDLARRSTIGSCAGRCGAYGSGSSRPWPPQAGLPSRCSSTART